MGCDTSQCFSNRQHKVQPNPDIAGIGVILAFLVPGWVSLLISICCALSRQSYFPPNRLDGIFRHGYQTLRQILTRSVSRATRRDLKPEAAHDINLRLGPALSEAAVTLADLQLVTGTAILATSYTQICSLTTYHYSIAYSIALTAFSTFQCTSSVARTLYQERGLLRLWRTLWLSSFVVLLLVAGVFWSGISRWWSARRYHFYFMNYAYPIHCQWSIDRNKLPPKSGFAPMADFTLLSLIVIGIVSSFLRVLTFLYPTVDSVHYPLDVFFLAPSWIYLRLVQRVRMQPQSSVEVKGETTDNAGYAFGAALFFSRILSALCVAVLTVLRSTCMDNIRAFGFLLFCHIQVQFEKMGAQQFLTGDEDQWGFGQILPLLLLVVPLFTLMSAFQKPKESSTTNEIGRRTHPIKLPKPATSRKHKSKPSKHDLETMLPAQVFDNRFDIQQRLDMLEKELFVRSSFEIAVLGITAAAIAGVTYAASYGVAI